MQGALDPKTIAKWSSNLPTLVEKERSSREAAWAYYLDWYADMMPIQFSFKAYVDVADRAFS